jgi:hypothetical protein
MKNESDPIRINAGSQKWQLSLLQQNVIEIFDFLKVKAEVDRSLSFDLQFLEILNNIFEVLIQFHVEDKLDNAA